MNLGSAIFLGHYVKVNSNARSFIQYSIIQSYAALAYFFIRLIGLYGRVICHVIIFYLFHKVKQSMEEKLTINTQIIKHTRMHVSTENNRIRFFM